MKKIKAITAALLAATMALTMTGCEEEAANPNGPINAPDGSSTEATTTLEPKDYVQEAAGQIADKVEDANLKVDRKIKWMSHWKIDETQAACELFKTVYGVPEFEADGKTPNQTGEIFDYSSVSYEGRFEALGAAIAGDDGPDMFQFDAADFPYGILKGRYQAVDDLLDVNSPKWSGVKDIMDQYKLNGKYYVPITNVAITDVMFYRKSMIEEIGADDPRDLFEAGKWDWDAFLDLARKWQSSGDNSSAETMRYVIDGYNAEDDFVISTGVPMVGSDGTKLINNLKTPEVERAMTDLIATLQSENLRYPRHELAGWGMKPIAWASGQILFYAHGDKWAFNDTIHKFVQRYEWPEDEVRFVPFPKDPQADKHYVLFKTDGYAWVKGSDYKDGMKAWLDCVVTVSGDPTVREAGIRQDMENYGWSRDNLEYFDKLVALDGSSPLTMVVEFKHGLGSVSDGSGCEMPVQSLTNLPYLTGESYVQKREEHNPAIQAAIDEINAAIAKG